MLPFLKSISHSSSKTKSTHRYLSRYSRPTHSCNKEPCIDYSSNNRCSQILHSIQIYLDRDPPLPGLVVLALVVWPLCKPINNNWWIKLIKGIWMQVRKPTNCNSKCRLRVLSCSSLKSMIQGLAIHSITFWVRNWITHLWAVQVRVVPRVQAVLAVDALSVKTWETRISCEGHPTALHSSLPISLSWWSRTMASMGIRIISRICSHSMPYSVRVSISMGWPTVVLNPWWGSSLNKISNWTTKAPIWSSTLPRVPTPQAPTSQPLLEFLQDRMLNRTE